MRICYRTLHTQTPVLTCAFLLLLKKQEWKKKGEEDSLRETLQMQVSKNAIRSVALWIYRLFNYVNFKIPQNWKNSVLAIFELQKTFFYFEKSLKNLEKSNFVIFNKSDPKIKITDCAIYVLKIAYTTNFLQNCPEFIIFNPHGFLQFWF